MVRELNYYRYPGILPFQDNELDRALFKGRDKEKEDLFNRVMVEELVILFSKSGAGKSSLLNAGLMQLLRENRYFPFLVHFSIPKYSPQELIYEEIKSTCQQFQIIFKPGKEISLWEYFKTAEFNSKDKTQLTPVLIFDQFESLLSLYSQEAKKRFFSELADLVRGRIPDTLVQKYLSSGKFSYTEVAPDIRVIISIREDFLAQLEDLSVEIPGIFQNRLRLEPLTREQARQTIIEPAAFKDDRLITSTFDYEADAVDIIINFLGRRRQDSDLITANEIEAFQLQLICHHIENLVLHKQAKDPKDKVCIRASDLGGEDGINHIMKNYYEKQIRSLESEKDRASVRQLCEDGLISRGGWRVSLDIDVVTYEYDVRAEILNKMVSSRILRAEPRLGSTYYELSHDTLLKPIRDLKEQSKEEGWKKNEGKFFINDFFRDKLEEKKLDDLSSILVRAREANNSINYIYQNAASSYRSQLEKVIQHLNGIMNTTQDLLKNIKNWDIVTEFQQIENIEINQYLQMVLNDIVIPEGITLKKMYQDFDRKITGNPVKLFYSLRSILEFRINAISELGKGEIIVQTQLKNGNSDTALIELLIEDSGKDIPPFEKNLIIDDPKSVKSSNEKLFKLAYACNMIQTELSGNFRIESGAGKGNRIIITLPASTKIQ